MEMSKEEMVKTIGDAVKYVFKDGVLVSPETHERHHRWTERRMELEQSRERLKQRVFIGVILILSSAAISGIGLILWAGYQAIMARGA